MKPVRRVFLVALACFVLSILALSASQQRKAALSSLSGIVVDAMTGNPIAGVQIAGPPMPKAILTDNDGVFQIENIAPGRVLVTFRKDGYLDQALAYGFVAGQPVKDSNISLSRAGVVSGHLSTSNGEAAFNVPVKLLGYRATTGGPKWIKYELGLTDDRGEFRLHDILPGRYLVAFGSGATENRTRDPKMEFPTLYPGVSRIADAEEIEVVGGQEIRLRNATRVTQQGELRIHFINGPGEPSRDVTYKLGHEVPASNGYQQTYSANVKLHLNAGESITRSILPGGYGIYSITTSWTSASGSSEFTVTPMEFNGETEDIAIVIARPKGSLNIQATKQQPDGKVVPLGYTRIGICSVGSPACPYYQFWVSRMVDESRLITESIVSGADGTRYVTGIIPGSYELYSVRAVQDGLPDGFYLASARQGNRDVLKDGIIVSEKSPTLEIQIRPNAGTVQGKVTDSKNHPIQNALVAILPEAPLANSRLQNLRRMLRTDQSGAFEIQGIAPGDYRAYAWLSVPDDAYLNEEFVAGYRNRGIPIHINVNSKGAVSLKVLNEL